jgi:hypothetical protein
MSEKPEPTYGGKRAGAGRKKSDAPSAAALKKREQRERKKAGETKPKGRPRKAPARSKSRTKQTTTTGAKPIKVQIEVTGAGRGSSRGTSRGRSASRGRGSVTPKVPPQIPAPAPIIVQPPPPDTSTNLALMGIQKEQQNTIAQTLQLQQEQIARGQEQFQQLTGTTREALLQMGDATKSRFERLETQMADIPERTTRMATNFILQSSGSRADNLQQPFSQEAPVKPAFHAPVFPEPLTLEQQSRQSSEAELKRTTSGLVGNDFNRTGRVGREFNALPDAPPEFKQRERDEVPSAFRNVRSSVQPILRASSDPIQERRAEQDATAIGKSLKREQESGLEDLSDVKQYLRLQKATAEAEDTSRDIEKLLKESAKPEVEVQSPLEKILSRGEQRRRQQWIKEGQKGTFEEWDKKRRIKQKKQAEEEFEEEQQTGPLPQEPVREAPPVEKSEPQKTMQVIPPQSRVEQQQKEQRMKEATIPEEEQAILKAAEKGGDEFFQLLQKKYERFRDLGLYTQKEYDSKIDNARKVARIKETSFKKKQEESKKEPIIREASEAEQKEAEEAAEETESEDEEEPELVFRGTAATTEFMKSVEKHMEKMGSESLKNFREQVKGKIPLTTFVVNANDSSIKDLLGSGKLSRNEFINIQRSLGKDKEIKKKLIRIFKKDNAGRDEDELDKLIKI